MKKIKESGFIILFLLICLLPSAGLLIGGHQESKENRKTSARPSLYTENGRLNIDFLSQTGQYFEENFAYRNDLVTAYDMVLEKVFRVSGQEGVIVGKNQWLYYKDSLEDFQGENLLTDRQLFDLAHSIAMMQDYSRKKGIRFVFTIAPNKNELYPANMPWHYSFFRSNENNFKRLIPWLKSEKVNYADVYQALKKVDETLYHKRDSHWTNKGAAIAADVILGAAGQVHHDYKDDEYVTRKDFNGDLNNMLYPAHLIPEENVYYIDSPDFHYIDETQDVTAPKILTESREGKGHLVMYRDSFGNALLPFMAEPFSGAFFSKAVPYYLTDLEDYDADTLIVERAERFIPDMVQNPPLIPAEPIRPEGKDLENPISVKDLKEEETGDYTIVSGQFPEDIKLPVQARIYIVVNGKSCYEAVPGSSQDGKEEFVLYLDNEKLNETDNDYEIYIR